MPKIKIWSTHTVGSSNIVVENEIYQPVRGGAYKEKVHTMQPDCEGDNISQKNASYCELTVQYWAWKNVNVDYYGFCHYRRMFAFTDEIIELDEWSNITCDYLTDRELKKFKVDDIEQISKLLTTFDIIAPVPVDLSKNKIKSVYEQYKKSPKLHIEDIDLTIQIIKDLTPQYFAAAKEFFSSSEAYFCNMFIMKKDLFDQYCNFLFTILGEFDKRKDTRHYSIEGYRTQGHIGERLFGVFLTYLKKQTGVRIGYKAIVFFRHTEKQAQILPAFNERNIPIVFASNEFYLQFLSVAILSLIENSSNENNYDLIILGKDFTTDSHKRLLSLIKGRDNFSLRFYDVGTFFAGYKLYESSTISIETYYRLVIPEVFAAYDKMLYLDGDIVILDDIAKLFEINIGTNYLGAVKDITHQGVVNGFDDNMLAYYKQFNCQDIINFINAGVLIMNTEKFRKNFSTKYLLDFAQQGNFKFQDQDLLNIICEDNIQYLDYTWNFFGDPNDSYRGWVDKYAPMGEYVKYQMAKNNIKIIHYAGNEKPWYFPNVEYADIFWQYFRKSPYYEVFLLKKMNDCAYNVIRSQIDGKNLDLKSNKTKQQKSKYLKLLPKGTRRREIVKKVVFFFQGKEYVTPDYESEGILVKYKRK